jgi:hypothetical protein
LGIFKQLLISHSVSQPPYSCNIFTFDDVTKIVGLFLYFLFDFCVEYAVNTFFEHFQLYQYVFIENNTLRVITCNEFKSVEHPKPFLPTSLALTEEEILEKAKPVFFFFFFFIVVV